MKMELSVKERFSLMMVIPIQGNAITFRLIQALRNAISLSEDELVKWMPTTCIDISGGCPRCQANEWGNLPFAPVKECQGCGFKVGVGGAPGSTRWRTLDDKGQPLDQTAEVEFSEAGMDLIADTLNLFNKNDELDDDTFPLYVKFVEEQGAEVGEAA